MNEPAEYVSPLFLTTAHIILKGQVIKITTTTAELPGEAPEHPEGFAYFVDRDEYGRFRSSVIIPDRSNIIGIRVFNRICNDA